MTVGAEYRVEPNWVAASDHEDPLDLFDRWLIEAGRTETTDATAMTLATASAEARPSARIVLLKGRIGDQFLFYSDRSSRKGHELLENPSAALLFHWAVSGRQVRIEGCVQRIDDCRSDAYFAGRDRGSQLGAWASKQSSALASRTDLIDTVDALDQRFAGEPIPRPDRWGGFALHAEQIEFWEAGPSRLHHRRLFARSDQHWDAMALYP